MKIKQLHFIFLLPLISSFYACDYFSFERKKLLHELDTIIDISTVDVFPSFSVCDTITDKEKKVNCFRGTIHKEITRSLVEEEIKVKKTVDETIEVVITVHSDHRMALTSLAASEYLLMMIPDFEARIKKSLQKLPKVRAAIKRGIPVTSEFKLPIRVKLDD